MYSIKYIEITMGTQMIHVMITGHVGLGVGSWPSNLATGGSNPKGTRLYFVILLKSVEKIFDWHWYNRLKDVLMCRYILILTWNDQLCYKS